MLNCRTFAARFLKVLVFMVSTYYKTDSYIDDLLQEVLKYGERMTKERPSSYYEMVGRLFIMFGVISTTAGELYYQEKESRRTLLAIKKIDYHRRIVSFNSLHEGLKGILGAVPLFRDRDYQKYPQVAVDDVLSERFCSILPFFSSICCKNGVILKIL